METVSTEKDFRRDEPGNPHNLLKFADLRVLNVQRVPLFGHGLNAWNALEWSGALCGEAGEAANVAKKIRRLVDGCTVNAPDRATLVAKLAEELADVITYADLLAASEGIDLGKAVAKKFNEVSERVGFPVVLVPSEHELERERAHRRELEERLHRLGRNGDVLDAAYRISLRFPGEKRDPGVNASRGPNVAQFTCRLSPGEEALPGHPEYVGSPWPKGWPDLAPGVSTTRRGFLPLRRLKALWSEIREGWKGLWSGADHGRWG